MDLLNKEGFLSIIKWILPALGATILWASSRSQLSSSMQISEEFALHHNCLQLAGLKTLVYLQGQPLQNSNPSFVINSYMISPTSPQPLSSSSSSQSSLLRSMTISSSPSSVIEDLIGSESGAYMNHSDEEDLLLGVDRAEPSINRHVNNRNQRGAIRAREYPPPIPHLARTENLAGHMPWILTRHYTNGKLIIKEERVKHHEYFKVLRKKGRLILNLVLLDDTVQCCHTRSSREELIEYENQESTESDEDEDECLDNYDDMRVVEERTNKGPIMIMVSKQRHETRVDSGGDDKRYGALRKCFTYTGREIYDTDFFCNGNTTVHECDGSYFAHPASAPLDIPMRPVATVM